MRRGAKIFSETKEIEELLREIVSESKAKLCSQAFLDYFAVVSSSTSSSCGAAESSRKRVIVEDVTNSPLFAGTEALAIMLEAGVRAVQSTPLITSFGQLIGITSTYYAEPYIPGNSDLQRFDSLIQQTVDRLVPVSKHLNGGSFGLTTKQLVVRDLDEKEGSQKRETGRELIEFGASVADSVAVDENWKILFANRSEEVELATKVAGLEKSEDFVGERLLGCLFRV